MKEQFDLGKLGEDFLIHYFRYIGKSAFKNYDPKDPVNDIFVEGLNGAQVKTQAPYYSKSGISMPAASFLQYKEFRAKILAVTFPNEKYNKPSHMNLTNRVFLIDPAKCDWEPSTSSSPNGVYRKVVIPLWKDSKWAKGVTVVLEDLNNTAKKIGFKYKDYLRTDLTTAMMKLSYKGE